MTVSENDNGFFDAVEETANAGQKVEIKFYSYIIGQKDIIIQELRDKIDVLNKHIQLLEAMNKLKLVDINESKTVVSEKPISVSDKGGNKNCTKPDNSIVTKEVNKQENLVGKNEVALEIMRVERENKLNKYIHMESDKNNWLPNLRVSQRETEWKTVSQY